MTDTDFEAPLLELQKQIDELARFPGDPDKEREAGGCARSSSSVRRDVYATLTPWQKTLVARHPRRPYTLDYVSALFTDFDGARTATAASRDDPAIVGGLRHSSTGVPVLVIGHQKGRDTKEKIYRNFGMPKPEGYRKALRLMQLAEKFAPADHLPSSTPRAPTRASTPRSAARPRRSRTTCARWPALPRADRRAP